VWARPALHIRRTGTSRASADLSIGLIRIPDRHLVSLARPSIEVHPGAAPPSRNMDYWPALHLGRPASTTPPARARLRHRSSLPAGLRSTFVLRSVVKVSHRISSEPSAAIGILCWAAFLAPWSRPGAAIGQNLFTRTGGRAPLSMPRVASVPKTNDLEHLFCRGRIPYGVSEGSFSKGSRNTTGMVA
jgi:hypothetical protein